MRNKITLGIIILIGLAGMVFSFQSVHPDNDELFELRNMQGLHWQDIFKRTTFYGDHTSFPGEFIIHSPMMAKIDIFKYPRQMNYEQGSVEVTKTEFWILAIPKILCTLLAIYLFCMIIKDWSSFSQITALSIWLFNSWIVYYSFSLRPYGILPELAIFNIYCASRVRSKWGFFNIGYALLIFFTCINHAYGPLMTIFPWVLFRASRPEYFFTVFIVSFLAWFYYAAYSNLGMSPNGQQSILDPFGYLVTYKFFGILLESLFSPFILTAFSFPFVALGMTNINWDQVKFISILVLLPLILIIGIDIKTHYIIHPRQYVWICPALGLWCGMMVNNSIKK